MGEFRSNHFSHSSPVLMFFFQGSKMGPHPNPDLAKGRGEGTGGGPHPNPDLAKGRGPEGDPTLTRTLLRGGDRRGTPP